MPDQAGPADSESARDAACRMSQPWWCASRKSDVRRSIRKRWRNRLAGRDIRRGARCARRVRAARRSSSTYDSRYDRALRGELSLSGRGGTRPHAVLLAVDELFELSRARQDGELLGANLSPASSTSTSACRRTRPFAPSTATPRSIAGCATTRDDSRRHDGRQVPRADAAQCRSDGAVHAQRCVP